MQYVKNKNRANAFLNNNNKTLVNSIFMHYLITFNMGRFHKKGNILKKTNRKAWADEIAFLPETLDQNGQMEFMASINTQKLAQSYTTSWTDISFGYIRSDSVDFICGWIFDDCIILNMHLLTYAIVWSRHWVLIQKMCNNSTSYRKTVKPRKPEHSVSGGERVNNIRWLQHLPQGSYRVMHAIQS